MANTDDKTLYFSYWGKACNEDNSYHLLPYHSLDVAAVGHILLKNHKKLKQYLAAMLRMEEPVFQEWMVYFLVMHDLGKFSESFQNLNKNLLLNLQQKTSNKNYALRHDSLGYMLWKESILGFLQKKNVVAKNTGSIRQQQTVLIGFDLWAMAVTGHHGTPPKIEGLHSNNFTIQDDAAACAFVLDAAKFLLSDSTRISQPDYENSQMASWWLSGFAVLCDWLGSNRDFFPYSCMPSSGSPLALSEYWKQTLEQADYAVRRTELLPVPTASLTTIQNLFCPYIKDPTPLQTCCTLLPLAQGSQLFILEDVTGSGKTEAAIMLAHRLLANDLAMGIYFALPTMATANAMYERMANVYQRLYQKSDVPPSLVLAHGARDLSDKYRQSIVSISSHYEDNYGDGTETASLHCSAWLADNRKKAMLAEVGIGTIDQALLAILPSRHQSLRLLGLMGKILIVDEVHACDAYVHKLLCRLLQAHSAAGGSVILLSATLPVNQRQQLIYAFDKGRNQQSLPVSKIKNSDYPLLTYRHESGLSEQKVATRKSVKRQVNVTLVHRQDELEGLITDAIGKGQCVCWIRNTVADAREAYLQLSKKNPDWPMDLFHARYAMSDRLNIENQVLERFGVRSGSEQRQARVLIATQVIEQSLDLDFDVMISDLAPIDLIIQRAGRLCRHARDIYGNRIEGPDQRGTPTLIVNSPELDKDISEDWYSNYFKRASYVYENHGQLWLTAKLLADNKGFRMPEDARRLIESIYGDSALDAIPEELQEKSYSAEGSDKAKSGLAEINALELELGYTGINENQWWEDALTPTRLGELTTTVYLARWDGNKLVPWIDSNQYAWSKSAVQLLQAFVLEEVPTETITEKMLVDCRKQLPAKGKWGVLLPLTLTYEDSWEGIVKNKMGERTTIYYSTKFGIVLEKEKQFLDKIVGTGAHDNA